MPNPPAQGVIPNGSLHSVKEEDDQVDNLAQRSPFDQDAMGSAPFTDALNNLNVNTTDSDPNCNPAPVDYNLNFAGTPVSSPIKYNVYKKRKPHQGDTLVGSFLYEDDESPPPSPLVDDFINFIDAINSPSYSPPSSPVPLSKKFRWAPVSAPFDASKLKPATTPKPVIGVTLPPLVSNGSKADAPATSDLSENNKWCLVLVNLLRHVDAGYIKNYHANNDLPAIVDVRVTEQAARACIYYDSQSEWQLARDHSWAIGVVDAEAAERPLDDHAAFQRIVLEFHYSHIQDPLAEIGSALAAYKVKVISVTRSAGNNRFYIVYLASLDDYYKALKIIGDIVVSTNNHLTVLTLRHDLSCTSNKIIIRLYVGGLPSNPCEVKILALLRTTVRLAGLEANKVVAFYVHRHQGNMKLSFGFAQVIGSDVAAALMNAVVGAKGAPLSISLAIKSKRKEA